LEERRGGKKFSVWYREVRSDLKKLRLEVRGLAGAPLIIPCFFHGVRLSRVFFAAHFRGQETDPAWILQWKKGSRPPGWRYGLASEL